MSDKSVYVIGSDAIITLVEPDLNLDSDSTESYTLGLVEWDSDAATVNLNDGSNGTFDPEPSKFASTAILVSLVFRFILAFRAISSFYYKSVYN